MEHVSLSLDDAADRLNVMRHQEKHSYAYRNYLPKWLTGSEDEKVNMSWREKICQWSYNVVDHFELSREVVSVSMSLFDRYIATQGNKCTGNLALLTSLTTLHIAIKIHDCKKIKINTLANLSRGQFGPKHIEEMEWRILSALKWKIHPPTQYAFISHMLQFMPQELNISIRREILDLSRYLTELAVCDSYFVDIDNSTVSFAAILNVMDEMGYARLSAGLREKFLRGLAEVVGFHHHAREVIVARERLRSMFTLSAASDLPRDFFSRVQDVSNDAGSYGGVSTGSARSASSVGNRPRTNSVDSKGSCRFTSPRRRFLASVSPMGSSRAHLSSSPMVAGVQ